MGAFPAQSPPEPFFYKGRVMASVSMKIPAVELLPPSRQALRFQPGLAHATLEPVPHRQHRLMVECFVEHPLAHFDVDKVLEVGSSLSSHQQMAAMKLNSGPHGPTVLLAATALTTSSTTSNPQAGGAAWLVGVVLVTLMVKIGLKAELVLVMIVVVMIVLFRPSTVCTAMCPPRTTPTYASRGRRMMQEVPPTLLS